MYICIYTHIDVCILTISIMLYISISAPHVFDVCETHS